MKWTNIRFFSQITKQSKPFELNNLDREKFNGKINNYDFDKINQTNDFLEKNNTSQIEILNFIKKIEPDCLAFIELIIDCPTDNIERWDAKYYTKIGDEDYKEYKLLEKKLLDEWYKKKWFNQLFLKWLLTFYSNIYFNIYTFHPNPMYLNGYSFGENSLSFYGVFNAVAHSSSFCLSAWTIFLISFWYFRRYLLKKMNKNIINPNLLRYYNTQILIIENTLMQIWGIRSRYLDQTFRVMGTIIKLQKY